MKITEPHPSKKIFVSHAAVDKEIVDQVVDLLATGMGIDVHGGVFCSSLEGIKIPPGEDFKQFIKEQIQQPEIVLLIISQNYLASQFCLAELGASWAMSHRVIPFLVPPIAYADLKAVLANVNALKIDDPNDWNEAFAVIREVLKIDPNFNRWERKRNDAISAIKALLPKQPQPPLVPVKKFTDVETKLKEANEEIRGLENEAKRLAKVLEETQKLKDKQEAAKVVLANLPEADAFDELVAEAVETMQPLPSVVCDALYYHFRGELLPGPRAGFSNTEDRWEEIHSAEEADYLSESGGGITINADDPKVRRAVDALTALKDFIRNTPDFAGPYEAEYEHQLSFSSRRFWVEHLL